MGKYRKLPFGYRMEMGRIVIDPVEAEWIVYIYEQYILGESFKRLADAMCRTGVYYDVGKQWNKNMVARILQDERYENHPTLMYDAVQLGWIQNIVIVDADLTMDLRAWYLKAARQFGWTKGELIEKISSNAHEELVLDIGQEICDNEYKELCSIIAYKTIKDKCILHRKSSWRRRCWGGQKRGVVLWHTMWSPIFTGKRIVFMRC